MSSNKRPEAGRPNKQIGALIVAQHTGKPLPYPLPGVEDRTHSPNTEMGRLGVLLKAYQPPHRLAGRVAERLVENLEFMQRHGHQKLRNANEWNTDGHWAHWCRDINAGFKSARELVDKGAELVDTTLTVHGITWAAGEVYSRIAELYLEWWCHQFWLMEQQVTPSGLIIGLGNRFEGGHREERDWGYALLRGVPHLLIKGQRMWENAEVEQDLFGLHLLRLLVADGAFADLRPLRPASASNWQVERFERGHVTSGADLRWERGHAPRGSDGSVSLCWVRYDGAKVGTSEPVPDFGRLLSSELLDAAPAPEER